MGLLKHFYQIIKFRLNGRNYVRSIGSGLIKIDGHAKLKKNKIYVYPEASIEIEENCILSNCSISVSTGSCIIGHNTILEGVNCIIENGTLKIDHHSRLSCRRIWIRFGGFLSIGKFTNINSGSEIRCDEKVTIGSFNQISYNVRIWDTNTHSILSKDERRNITIEKFPYFGFEKSKPKTLPVSIGDDCWIGENSTILKGTRIGNEVIVGYGTLISNKAIPDGSKVFTPSKLEIR